MNTQSLDSAQKPKVFVVDDQAYYAALVGQAIGDFCTILPFSNGEAALAAAQESAPDLMLLDVEMPGIDGYETCRRLKADPSTAAISVIFVSGHDEIEDRLKGYEAGGQDYMIKPFDFKELKSKVEFLLAQAKERAELKSQVDSVSTTAMLVMSNMSEVGVLLDALRRFNACNNYQDLAQEMVRAVSNYDLQAIAQVSGVDGTVRASSSGTVSPREESVIIRMSEMGERIVEFKSRMSVSYEHATLLINNVPVADPEFCGRLRDHLAMLVEGADVRVQGINAMHESNLRKAIETSVAGITETLNQLDSDQRLHRLNVNAAVLQMRESIESALLRVALSEAQEEFMLNAIQQGVDNIIQLQTNELGFQSKLTEITQKLKAALVSNNGYFQAVLIKEW